MKPRHSIYFYVLILFFLFLTATAIFKFPKTIRDLQKIKINDTISTSEGDLLVLDILQAKGQTSWYCLTADSNDNYFVLMAYHFPFIKRYELFDPISIDIGELHDAFDYYKYLTIRHDGKTLEFTENKRNPTIYMFALVFLFYSIQFIQTYRKDKKRFAGKNTEGSGEKI